MAKILKLIVVTSLTVPIDDISECVALISEIKDKFRHLERYTIELHSMDGQDICETLVTNTTSENGSF